ncbi:hypothetical protein [Effusibacillus consociatus]|uniref:Glycosyltransferase family 1 protein n=1 Tax=Effusibacillus consociatus TaxID=1117041 RepID=A0ABV9PXS3_9BACL
MNIGILSSYAMKCGIAEYSVKLYRAFEKLGYSATVFGNFGGDAIRDDRKWSITVPPSDIQAVECFYAAAWSISHKFDLDLIEKEIGRRNIELMIVQYQNGIINDHQLQAFLELMEQKDINVIVAFHDSCIGPSFPFHLVKNRVTLSKGLQLVIPASIYIPQGVPEPPNETKEELRQRYGLTGSIVSTFGLGRTDYQLISDVCLELGYTFMVLDSTNNCRITSPHLICLTEWYPLPELIKRLAASDVIVLWYHEIDAYVSSSAARHALATRRPVIVNDVAWFADLPEPVLTKVKTKEQLKIALKEALSMEEENLEQGKYIQDNAWTAIAKKYLNVIKKA